ncbi:MAG: TonB-dependent receptor, partial [Sphingobacteriales bacterium]
INTTYETAKSYRDEVSSERFYINPSFLFKLSNKTEILLEGDFLKDNRTNDYGTGAVNYELANVPRNRFLGAKWSNVNTVQKGATATISHRFNERWEIKSTSAVQDYSNDLFSTTRPNASNNFVKADGKWIRGVQRTQINENYYISQLDLTGKFSTGSVKHAVLFGADADKYNTATTAYTNIAKYDSINIYDLNMYKQRNDIPNLDTNTLTKAPISRTGIYIQDLISITEKLKVLAGARFTYIETSSNVYTAKTKATTEAKNFDGAVTPRFGLVYQPKKYISIFASYANSFTLNTGVDINGKPLAPSFIDQYEAGIKNDLFKGLLSANLTVYQIKNSGLAQQSLENGNTNANIKELAGEVTSKGLEVDIMSKPIHGFSFLAGYSYNETRYTKSNIYIIGSLLRYNPNHTANASAYYTFPKNTFMKGFNVGLNATYIGERQAGRSTRLTINNDAYKLISLRDYTLLDFSAGYAKGQYSIRAKVSNLSNELNYNAHDDNSINPIAPRMFFATLAYKL